MQDTKIVNNYDKQEDTSHVENHDFSNMDVEDGPKQQQAGITWTPDEEKKALRKLDWCLIPLLGSLYLVSYIDRGNIGNAYTAGMGSEWGITSNQYSMIVTIYYIAYISFHWLILVWKFVPLRLWTAMMALGWGSMSILQAATHNFAGIMALRFLIGVFEAGFVPAVALYMTFFYHRREMGLRYGLFISFSPLASCFASALAYGLVHAKTSISNWQLLFIVEGIPTVILAGVAYIYLPASPRECVFLDARQNEIIGQRAVNGRGQDQERKLNFKQVFAAFYDYKNYLQAAIIFCLNTAFGSLPAYLPTILTSMGFTSLRAQGLSACPYLAAYAVCVTASFLSDRAQTRGAFVAGFSCAGATGYIILATVHTTSVRYFATFLVCAGVFPAVAIMFTWVTDNQGSSSKRGAGLAIFGMIGQCGPILGARIFPKTSQPYYAKGMWICAGVLLLAAFIATILSLSLRWQNKRRDEKHGKSDLDYMPEDIADVGDAHPMYRYVLLDVTVSFDFKKRFYVAGGGGYSLNTDTTGGLKYGAVAGATDGGYDAFNYSLDEKFLLGNGSINWDATYMFSYQALGEMTQIGKYITKELYDMSSSSKVYTYYEGCSDGGREGMSQVQRWGDEYDGVIAGAPAFRFSQQQVLHVYPATVEHTLDYYPPPCELKKIVNATIDACDGLDGRKDGVISRTDLCKLHFNLKSLIGKEYYCAAESSSSLGFGFSKRQAPGSQTSDTPEQNGTISAKGIAVAQAIYDGVFNSKKEQAYLSWQIGSELSDGEPTYDNETEKWTLNIPSTGGMYVAKFIELLDLDNLDNLDNVTYDTLVQWMDTGLVRYYDSLQTTHPDLTTFKKAGGKLLHYHGESDPSIPAGSSVHYWQSVRSIMYPDSSDSEAQKALSEWYQFYLVPGAAHCGANSLQPGPYPQNNMNIMIDWVENGKQPSRLNATVSSGDYKGETQMLCQWPKRPLWTNDKSFKCVDDKKSIESWTYDFNAFKIPVF